jgi:hypothetical protein
LNPHESVARSLLAFVFVFRCDKPSKALGQFRRGHGLAKGVEELFELGSGVAAVGVAGGSRLEGFEVESVDGAEALDVGCDEGVHVDHSGGTDERMHRPDACHATVLGGR